MRCSNTAAPTFRSPARSSSKNSPRAHAGTSEARASGVPVASTGCGRVIVSQPRSPGITHPFRAARVGGPSLSTPPCKGIVMSHRKSGLRPIVLASLFAFCSAPAFAERSMAVDDAGTLERGGAKLEFGWSRDDAVRGYEGAAASVRSTTSRWRWASGVPRIAMPTPTRRSMPSARRSSECRCSPRPGCRPA